MTSPFPGMDPYIEACGLWEDFHGSLIQDMKSALARMVPERYLVRSGERSYVVLVGENGKVSHPFLPDVSVTTPRRKKSAKKDGMAVAELASEIKPVTMCAFVEEEYRETFIEIYEADPDKRLVTSIEVLSPSNKRPNTEGWELYQRKRQGHLLGGVNLVEIDLLREGRRMPMLDPWPDSPYTVLVARAKKPQLCKVWPCSFRRPLPTFPIPMAKPDPDIPLNLQPIVDDIYQRFHYQRSIDYTKPLTPPLTPEEAAWLEQQLRTRAGRS